MFHSSGSQSSFGNHWGTKLLLVLGLMGAAFFMRSSVTNLANAATDLFTPDWTSSEMDATTSIAWGDYDNDGDLDLAVGNASQPNRVYHNDGGKLFLAWSSDEADNTKSIAWGDYDNNGTLDLAVGNNGQPNRVYRNSNGNFILAWTSSITESTTSIAWGDYDNDSDLDLATNLQLYRNNNGAFTMAGSFGGGNSIAWGDYDTDGSLDIAVGNQLYHNNNGIFTAAGIFSGGASVAWGDYDNDGDLDLAVGHGANGRNSPSPIFVYQNNNGTLTLSWTANEKNDAHSVAWGDYDNDGDLDLVAGNDDHYDDFRHTMIQEPNRLYRNDNGAFTLAWTSPENDGTTSIAWGDYDSDGDLDLAAGNAGLPNRLYRNDYERGAAFTPIAVASGRISGTAWGDYDNDGDLDIAVGTREFCSRFLLKNEGGMFSRISLSSECGSKLAWGDYDGDGDLDLVVDGQLYRNDGGKLLLAWSSNEADNTTSIAWGDYDNNGTLDLAVGNNGQPNRVYRNTNGNIILAWTAPITDSTESVAWGDYDGDGDLDLAVGNGRSWVWDSSCQCYPISFNRLYVNDHGNLILAWSSSETGDTKSIAWADYDGDGDLDLAVGNNGPNRLYQNNDGMLTLAWITNEADATNSLAWGDYDGDLDLDLAVGNVGPNRLYRNDDGVFSLVWSSTELETTTSIAWGDYDSDGDIDLLTGQTAYYSGNVKIYRNNLKGKSHNQFPPTVNVFRPGPSADGYSIPHIQSGYIPIGYIVFHPQNIPISSIHAWYSLDGGGKWLPAVAASGTITTNLSTIDPSPVARNYSQSPSLTIPDLVTTTATINITDTATIVDLNVWVNIQHTCDGDLVIKLTAPFTHTDTLVNRRGGAGDNFTNTIFDDEAVTAIVNGSAPFNGRYRPEKPLTTFDGFSPQGNWKLSISDMVIGNTGVLQSWGINLTLNNGHSYTYYWDVNSSGFFGQSDNIVFRIQAVPAIINRPNSVPGPYLYGAYASTSTFPFRARGTQVRVYNETVAIGHETVGAMVYRTPNGQSGNGQPITDISGQPFQTNLQGYLQGRGEINPGDKLMALAPVASGSGYTLYHTSAAPTSSGLNMFTITSGGVQTLTVSSANPLLLFDLSISLEWDARQDTKYLNQLKYDIQKASALLYDWSNGQVALGKVTIYHDRLHWDDADVRIYANNRRRPMAAIGGIVAATQPDPNKPALLYEPGMIHMGAIWNRYGNPSGNIGDDWALALAHEFAHYALYIEDNYLGLDAQQHLISVTSCAGSAMSDPYRDDYSEFKLAADWSPGCDSTLSEKTTGRSDWETIHAFYPALNWTTPNVGPAYLPLAVTQISEEAPVADPQALADPRFYVTLNSASYQPGNDARAFLFRNLPTRLVDLGRPVVDSVLAYGAQPGDKVCVIEITAGQSTITGCKTVSANDNQQLPLASLTNWQPEILVTPITTRTVDIAVGSLPAGLSLSARLYPNDSAASGVLNLVWSATTQQYTGRFNLADYTTEGHVRIWAGDEATTAYEAVTDFALGGNPINRHLGGINHHRGGRINRHLGGAPGISLDGQVVLYADALDFPTGEFYTLQAATRLPDPPAWATLVGHGYWLRKSAGAPNLGNLSFSMGYLDREVPPGGENWLKIYRWDSTTQTWLPLDTDVDDQNNSAIAVIPGEGLYALMTSIALNLTGPGWETFSYPVQDSPTVAQALSSIAGSYTTVYWYNRDDSADPWKVYDNTGIPDWVNDLDVLHFAEAYWIRLTQSVRLWIKPGEAVQAVTQPEGFPSPPATYYGPVLAASSFTSVAGMPVTAWVNGVACGSTQTQEQGGQIVYAINIHADGLNTLGCGTPGKMVRFKVGERWMGTSVAWNNDQVWLLSLDVTSTIYLPIIQR